MDTQKTFFSRRFLVKGLPDPLTPADEHVQIFDNYILNTRLRLRSVRVPATNQWTRTLEQILPANPTDLSVWKISKIQLDEAEYNIFRGFEGTEIRKNRYFHEFDEQTINLDIFLGDLWGLNIGSVEFESEKESKDFKLPDFSLGEITGRGFFTGINLVTKTFADVREEFSEMKGQGNR